MAKLQSIYAQTAHTAQGSTHGNTFVDMADIRRRSLEPARVQTAFVYCPHPSDDRRFPGARVAQRQGTPDTLAWRRQDDVTRNELGRTRPCPLCGFQN